MDPANLTIAIRGVLSAAFVLVAIGFAALGFWLYSRGVGSSPEKATLKWGKLHIATNSAGAWFVAAAIAAIVAAVLTAPSLSQSKDSLKVASFSALGTNVKAPTVVAELPPGNIPSVVAGKEDPTELTRVFSHALSSKQYKFSVKGKPAVADLTSSKAIAVTSETGKPATYVITTKFVAGDDVAILGFRPLPTSSGITFYPIGIFDAAEYGVKKDAPSSSRIAPAPLAEPPGDSRDKDATNKPSIKALPGGEIKRNIDDLWNFKKDSPTKPAPSASSRSTPPTPNDVAPPTAPSDIAPTLPAPASPPMQPDLPGVRAK